MATAVTREAGHQVYLLDAQAKNLPYQKTMEMLEFFQPNIAVIWCTTPTIYNDIAFTNMVKIKDKDCMTVLVGAHPSSLPEETLKISDKIDAVAVNEFDYTIRDLANGTPMENCLGLVYRKGNKISRNKPRPFIEDLNSLPFPAWEFLDVFDYHDAGKLYPFITQIGSRGCPNICTFCDMRATISGGAFRKQSPQRRLDEIQHDFELFPMLKEIMIEDDTLVSKENERDALDFCWEIINRGMDFTWSANARPNIVNSNLLRTLKKCGLRNLCVLPNTQILTKGGYKQISEVKEGELILTKNNRFKKINELFSRDFRGDLIKIKPHCFPELKLTPNHPVHIVKGSSIRHYKRKIKKDNINFEWCEAGKIKKEDFVVVPIDRKIIDKKSIKISSIIKNLQIIKKNETDKIIINKNIPKSSLNKYKNPDYTTGFDDIESNIEYVKFDYEKHFIKNNIEIDEDFCLLLGYYFAEGCSFISKNRTYTVCFTFSPKERKYGEFVYKTLFDKFGIKPLMTKNEERTEVRVNSKTLMEFFIYLSGKRANEFKIPKFLLHLPLEKQKMFLIGLFRGDAGKVLDSNGFVRRLILISESKEIKLSLMMMFLRLGIISSVCHQRKTPHLFRMSIFSDDIKKIPEITDLKIRKNKINNKLGFIYKNWAILSIDYIKSEQYSGCVMNIEVEEDETYTANMICVHNCVGYEFGSQKSLDAVNKRITLDEMRMFSKLTRMNDIEVNGCFMIGAPDETRESAIQTIEFAKELNPNTAQFSVLVPYPATHFYNWAKQNGFIVAKDWTEWVDNNFEQATVISYPQLSREEMTEFADRGLKEFYLRKDKIIELLFNIKSMADIHRFYHGIRSYINYFLKI
jgi:radical SAM superfamily enzyme YgiQ (UPF0313 family)/intein/homing endonuclease